MSWPFPDFADGRPPIASASESLVSIRLAPSGVTGHHPASCSPGWLL